MCLRTFPSNRGCWLVQRVEKGPSRTTNWQKNKVFGQISHQNGPFDPLWPPADVVKYLRLFGKVGYANLTTCCRLCMIVIKKKGIYDLYLIHTLFLSLLPLLSPHLSIRVWKPVCIRIISTELRNPMSASVSHKSEMAVEVLFIPLLFTISTISHQ